ncbi:class IV lanthionine synthetase LanL [Streptomyces sp. NPDC023998]|uniref:class IV lanthionine synthetase LanL n=1 Tax=Streptomyces sp. NPDC023998 TaxID=3154597 RepID=UPI0033D07D4E
MPFGEGTVPTGGFALQPLVRLVLSAHGAGDWEVTEKDIWCRVSPPDSPSRVQGWKLHISATPLSAPTTLHRSAQVLIRRGCAFKFAARTEYVETLTSSRSDRAQCGKFITAYPDDDHFWDLAKALDEATAGLPGPAILSDRPYRRGSVVHYRYGAFRGVPHWSNDGVLEARLRAPDGTVVKDERKPWFCPPPWAKLPPTEANSGAEGGPPPPPPQLLLRDRYLVRSAIRHSARGGVYRAVDRETRRDVVVKQARAHVGAGFTGRDARDGLRDEAAALATLHGLSADLVELFEQDDHVFLVETEIPGVTLDRWVRAEFRALGAGDLGLYTDRVVVLAAGLAALLSEVHGRGLVYRDLSPANVMVPLGDRLRLIDPECVARAGQWGHRVHTPGYGAPEYASGPKYGPAPEQTADLFSLGAMLFYLATGIDPAFASVPADPRPPVERLNRVLGPVGLRSRCARLLAPAIRGLCAQEPVRRWSLGQLREFLADPAPPPAAAAATSSAGLEGTMQERLIDDCLAHVLVTMGERDADRLWPVAPSGTGTDPCNVQHGAAGVLGVFTRADEVLGRHDLRTAVAHVASWIDARRADVPAVLPGLHFGGAGIAWTLHDAARHLGDDELAEHAARLALALPVRWPNPDVFHGAAGAGLTQLRFWQLTGRPEFLDRAIDCADGLVAAAEHADDGVSWRIPPDFDSVLAGVTHLGFAHGVAGIGSFLVSAATSTGRGDYLDLAHAAGRTLVNAAERGPWGARWRTDRTGKDGEGMLHHLCNGASGVGTFLVRLWTATGDPSARELAEEAASAVHRARWTAGSSVCHGLAGDGEFLLDMAQAFRGPYQDWAEELAGCLYAKHTVRNGRMVVPDESGTHVRAAFGVGLAGVIGFLLRLRYGGPRLLMADTDRPRATTGPPKAAPRGGALTPGSAQHGRPGSRNNHQEETPWN